MTTSAVSAMGAFLSWDGVELAEITNMTGPNSTLNMIDATHYGTPFNFREFVPAFFDGGTLNVEGHFIYNDTDGQLAFIVDFQARSTKAVVVTLQPSASTQLEFNAVVENLEFTYPMEGLLGFTASLKITGAITRQTTASAGISALSGIEENAGAALTFSPAFANGTYAYNVSVNTASDWIKITVTAASHTINAKAIGTQSSLTSGSQSGEITIGAAGTKTLVSINVYEANKVAKIYRILVDRAAA